MSTETAKKQTVIVDISALSTEDMQAELSRRMQHENELKAQKKQKYEERREQIINRLGARAKALCEQMQALKTSAMDELLQFREEMMEYGDLRGGENNKGNFELKNDLFKVQFVSHICKGFDERAVLAEQKLRAFLESFVRKRDTKTYKIIAALLERSEKTGDYDINLINRLYKMEDEFEDENWKQAIALFKESYSPTKTALYVRFFHVNQTGGYENIVLDFAKAKALPFTPANAATTKEA